MKSTGRRLDLGLETNHWASRMIGARSWSYRHRRTDNTWSNEIWPDTSKYLRGTPSAYGEVEPGYAVWDHGFWGV